MKKYIKIPVTESMIRDYEECARMMDEEGREKECSGCSCNGGDNLECLGEYRWIND